MGCSRKMLAITSGGSSHSTSPCQSARCRTYSPSQRFRPCNAFASAGCRARTSRSKHSKGPTKSPCRPLRMYKSEITRLFNATEKGFATRVSLCTPRKIYRQGDTRKCLNTARIKLIYSFNFKDPQQRDLRHGNSTLKVN